MKIALVYPHMAFAVPEIDIRDALAIVNYEIARRLAEHHTVTVFARRMANQQPVEIHQGVTWYRPSVALDRAMCSLKLLDDLGLTAIDRPFHLSSLYYANYARIVAHRIRESQCDIAHVHSIPQLLPAIRRRNPYVRLVFHTHDHSLIDFDATALRSRLQHAALVLACGDHITRKLRDRFPEFADRCHTLHNGVDQRFLQITAHPAQSQAVLFVGRLSPEKGVHILLEAFQAVAGLYPEAQLRLVGPLSFAPQQFIDPRCRDAKTAALRCFYSDPKRYMSTVRAVAGTLGERVVFEDSVPNHSIAAHYADAGIFVFPSVWHEPFGIPIIEAMAAGLPVITTRGGAASEIVVDGETGFLVERGDVGALSAALGTLLSNPGLRMRMGAAGRDRVARLFTWDRAVSQLLGLYEQALGVEACKSPMRRGRATTDRRAALSPDDVQ